MVVICLKIRFNKNMHRYFKRYGLIFILAGLLGVSLNLSFIHPSFAKVTKKEKNHPKQKNKKDEGQEPFADLNTLIVRGQHTQALEILKTLQSKKIKENWKNRIQFLTAYLNFKSHQYEEAIRLFAAIDQSYPIIRDYIRFYHAIALRKSGKIQESIKVFQKLQSELSSAHLDRPIQHEMALAYCKAKDRGTAIDMLNALIQTEPSETKIYHARFDRAQCLIDLGDEAEAFTLLRSLYLNYPEGDLNEAVLATIKKLSKTYVLSLDDYLRRAEQLLNKNRPELAIIDLQEAAKFYEQIPPDFKRKLAETYFKARLYPQAAQNYEGLRREFPDSFNLDDQEQLARAYARSDQFEIAIPLYEGLLLQKPKDEESLLYRIAFLTFDQGKLAEAKKKFLNLLEKFPKHSNREQIYWYLAWGDYLQQNYDSTLSYFDQLEKNYPNGRFSSRIPYWHARVLDKQGKHHEARALYQKVASEQKYTYYSFLSLKRLQKNLNASIPPTRSSLTELPKLKAPRPLYFHDNNPEAQNTTAKLQELLLVGLWEDFLGELETATQSEGISAELNDFKTQMSSSPERPSSEQGSWEQRYPAAYPTLISFFAKSRGLPVALAWAIMREESSFRPSIVSPAQAIGLMQIIPPTGNEIARNLGRLGFTPDDLFKPVVNIEYGVHYLTMNLDRFRQNLIFTIASYNAGPEAIERWNKSRPGREWDEFVEEIPYSETQNYVKKVLKSYYLYSLIYAAH